MFQKNVSFFSKLRECRESEAEGIFAVTYEATYQMTYRRFEFSDTSLS